MFKTRKNVLPRVGIVAAVLMAGVFAAVPAQAAEPAGYQEVRSFWDQYGVDSDTQSKLLDKLEAGQAWDNVAGTAVSSRVTSSRTADTTIKTFKDGSITVTTQEKAAPSKGGATIQADKQGCTYSSGSGYSRASGCSITNNWGNVQGGFKVSYTLVNGGRDYISSAGSPTTRCVVGDCNSYNVTRKANEDATGKANAHFTWHYSNPLGSWDYRISIYVGGDTVTLGNS